MVTERLGAICHAHVVHADRSDYGALDENCIKLAELAATAVDFPKTGIVVTMPPHLIPKDYGDSMEKEEFQTYPSKKILGRLYRKLNGLLGQYKVNWEEEVVTGHVWSMPKYKSRKQGELKERLKQAYTALKKEYRQLFENMDLEFENLSSDERNILYEQKASAWYQVCYHPKWVRQSLELQGPEGGKEMVMLSFAWIAADYLARIKIRSLEVNFVDSHKPIDSLARPLCQIPINVIFSLLFRSLDRALV
ncbi:RNA-dependent RNA polymerase, eukaryotic-type [Dillenia turbinata]|uniref:RNA-dependent RNA polymerase, eukaryotic-type n=1 Tax=Dillenia turbinata TaxID=194707 RepID=A0AAN8UBU0_9MAGN